MFKADDSVRSAEMKWRSTRFSGVPELSGRADTCWCHTLSIDGSLTNILYNELDPNLFSKSCHAVASGSVMYWS